jgi:hypothetical protein
MTVPRIARLSFAVLAAAWGLGALSASAQESHGPISLFNGKDLTGWTPVLDKKDANPADTWSVVDGVLKCTGKPAGYIKTDKEYENYIFRAEWRWPADSKGGNNGVLIHSTTPNALGVWPRSIEVQLMAGNAGDFWVIPDDAKITIPDQEKRQQGRRHINLTDGAEKPFGEWNQIEITSHDGTVKVKVNGTLVNEGTNSSERKGAISLQSEGAPIEFRNITIEPLR